MEIVTMKTKIAVATVDGKTYYELVNSLQKKNMPFISLKPWDTVPLNIKVVLTTKDERKHISHSKILILEKGSNPESVIDEAVLAIRDKQKYEKIIVGVDPGISFGIAIIGDNTVIETNTKSKIENAANIILKSLKRFQANEQIIRVGDGIPEYSRKLLSFLSGKLPKRVIIELVHEAGTSRMTNNSINRRVIKDAVSAVKIARRKGKVLSRKKLGGYKII
jgi:hypothetical protein